MTDLLLHNSLTGKKEAFAPLDPANVRLYACGPTVYSYAHIGNARMAVVFDLLVRVLRRRFARVTYVSNITDVDDKIITAAAQTGEAIDAITEKYGRIYNEDMAALGCAPPDVQPKATEHIPEMVALCETLVARGHAYAADGHVLFNVPSYPNYGRLSNRNRDDQIAGARVEVAPYKKDPADFVLWKPSTDGQPGWDSPWGRGRPGWHIECSAMAEKYLGRSFDIHGGGADLKFPHHENEIAQSCCAHGHEDDPSAFAKFWVHNGFVTVEGEKMAKSVGNIRLVHDLVQHYDGEVLRLALLSAHYRQPLDWSEETLLLHQKLVNGVYQALFNFRSVAALECDTPREILGALDDDLNTPKAIAVLLALHGALVDEEDKAEAKGKLLAAGKILGLLQKDPAVFLGYGQGNAAEKTRIDGLLAERAAARQAKNFARADEIRKTLEADGIVIEDTASGVQWRRT